MCDAMVMVTGKDAVFPAVEPVIGRKQVPDKKRRKKFGELKYIAVYQYRKVTVIRENAIIVKKITFYGICPAKKFHLY